MAYWMYRVTAKATVAQRLTALERKLNHDIQQS